MGEPSARKRKLPSNSEGPIITDSRFAKFQSDPRYRLPGKKHHVKLDKRFSRILEEEDFSRRSKVDRYGRPVDTEGERKRLKRRYEFEEDENLAPDNDVDVQNELQRVEKHDPLRDGRESASSSEESSSDEYSEGEEEIIALPEAQGGDIPKGEVTSRIAVVNLDWDNIRATDLMAVFSSFLPSTGRLTRVSVYPSDFGKERMEREEMEGPPKDIFTGKAEDYSESESESEEHEDTIEDERIKARIVKTDDGDEFDSAKLRQYQLERLRYYFAILDFSSPSAAKAVYDVADGAEYLSTANFFDLRFVPDGTDFASDIARDECTGVPEGYKPNEFVTDALQHSKVKLTWDAEDVTRKEVQARAFRGNRKDIDENDLKAYLGTDSSEEDEGEEQVTIRKEQERQKMRALLGLGAEPAPRSNKDDQKRPVGDLQITFSSGLPGNKDTKKSVFENDPEPNETTLERYVRKERERKQQRKSKLKGTTVPEPEPEVEDAGFDDPFFAEPSNGKASASKLRKEERMKKRAEREAEEKASAAKRAELELLMVDDKDTEMRHFDMNEIEKIERRSKKKGKKGKKSKDGEEKAAVNDNFDIETQDPRFARLFENHELAIDPTNPRFKGTAGMKKLLDEGRKRRKYKGGDVDLEDASDVRNDASKTGANDNSTTDIRKLVEKVKKRK